jgi:hypothetical protein
MQAKAGGCFTLLLMQCSLIRLGRPIKSVRYTSPPGVRVIDVLNRGFVHFGNKGGFIVGLPQPWTSGSDGGFYSVSGTNWGGGRTWY